MRCRFDIPRIQLLPVCASAFLLAGSAAARQDPGWSVDLSQATLAAAGETYTDHSCNGVAPVPRPGLGATQGLCPPYPPLPPVPFDPGGVISRQETQVLAGPFSFLGQSFDLGGGVTPTARDSCPFAVQSTSLGTSRFLGDGLGTRTLLLTWTTRVNNVGIDTDWYCRGCVDLDLVLPAELEDVPAVPFLVRYDLAFSGNADTTIECGSELGCQEFPDDVEQAEMTTDLDFNGAGPGRLVDSFLDSQVPGLPVFLLNDSRSASFAAGTAALDVTLDLYARSSAKHQTPEQNPADGANFDGLIRLHLIVHDFLADEPFDSYMRAVPGGPYSLRMGRSEVTNQQYADFLNSAELDGGATELGSFMVFDSDGVVRLADGTLLIEPKGAQAESHVEYEASAPLGTRYTVEIASGASARSYENHPVNFVTWLGAVKFCNWLTLKRGLAPDQRCYTEGTSFEDWHPVTISTSAWLVRDLNQRERALLVAGRRGFRLPMDGLGGSAGWIGGQSGTFNEWYRAAAFDPNGPATTRTGPGGETVAPKHWIYGIGRDVMGSPDANFFASGDPFDEDDAFVALYDGSVYNTAGSELVGNGGTFASAATTNPWGFFDLSGNIAELVQERPGNLTRVVRGGSWLDAPEKSAASYRELAPLQQGANFIGFRVAQATSSKSLPSGPPKPL